MTGDNADAKPIQECDRCAQKGQSGLCPVCGRRFRLHRNGDMVPHNQGGKPCDGTGRPGRDAGKDARLLPQEEDAHLRGVVVSNLVIACDEINSLINDEEERLPQGPLDRLNTLHGDLAGLLQSYADHYGQEYRLDETGWGDDESEGSP